MLPAPSALSLSAPASRNASRCSSPLASRRVSSAPPSPRAATPQAFRQGAPMQRSPTAATRRQPYHAVFGSEARNTSSRNVWPAQKVRTPELCGFARRREASEVHAYSGGRSTLKTAGATMFGNEGKASRGVRAISAPMSSGPSVHSYAPVYSSFAGRGAATFGTPHATPRPLRAVHNSKYGLMSAAPRNSVHSLRSHRVA